MNIRKVLFSAFVLGVGSGGAVGAEQATGFVEGISLDVTNRNFYFNRDFRNGQSSPTGNGYSEEWAHAIIGEFRSGFTDGAVGFGVDAFAMLGLKLDSGGGRSGAGGSVDLLPYDSAGRPESSYSKVGGALKARLQDTEVKIGDIFPQTPVVYYGDYRLLPQSFRGLSLVSTDIDKLTVQAGRLHSMSQPNTSSMRDDFATFYAGPVDSPWVAYFGGDYDLSRNINVSLYTSRLKDAWNQHYAGTSFNYPLANNITLTGGLNYYKAVDEGRKLLGRFDNDIYSGNAGVQFGPHTVTVALQRNSGDDDFDYLRQSGSIYLDNSIQYSDFNSPKENSRQIRYNLDLATFGWPGLSLMTRYAQGRDANYSGANEVYVRRDEAGTPLTNQKRWERNVEATYVLQSGGMKGLTFRLRQATTRATEFESDLDEVRLIVEYPLEVL
ncbi:OprD family porin [Halopseudomonas pelagia]|uniref:OprD family porin n=1 Tax=Halopseudomonas pelagia TaxID=553151 RepID=UPI0030D99AEA|tara:strand:- start:772 stop:2088 length:1317 start_codon:yes stop_codon:yes gene_type:complete